MPTPRRSRALNLLASSLFLLRVGATITAINLPLFVVSKYGVGLEAGFTIAVELLPSVLFGPVIGDWIDRSDARKLAIAGPIVTAPAVALFPYTTAFWQLMVLAIISGAGYTIGVPARMALRSRAITPGRETPDNGFLVAAQRTASLLGPAASAPLLLLGFKPIFLVDAVTSVIAALLLTRFPSSATRRREVRDPQAAYRRNSWLAALKADLRRVYLTGVPELFRAVLRDRPLAALSATAFTYQLAFGMTRLFLTSLVVSRGEPTSYYAALVTLMAAGAILGSVTVARFSKVPQGWLYLVVNVLEAAAWVGVVLSGSFPISLVLVAVIGICESFGTVVFYSEAQGRLPTSMEGRFFAVLIPYTDAFTVVGAVLAGLVSQLGASPVGLLIAAVVAGPVLLLAPIFIRSSGWKREVPLDERG